ncbi:SixA phosphatase family protein [Lysobacter niabensis]|uniref:SixA phosphatase family protein n=1 Tax=Agrilutibacter niabensis TaxID=380628 RepID=UPI00361453BA
MLRHPGPSAIAVGLLLAAAVLAGCASRPAQPEGTTFILVRHAEKADDGSKDPPLNAAGTARAQALAADLRDAPVRAAYATAYRRTQATAAPTASAHSLQVMTYDAKLPAGEFAARLRQVHADGTVLVVGHSNTVPDIAAALCQCSVPPMGDDEFDRRITIRIDAQGHAALQAGRY